MSARVLPVIPMEVKTAISLPDELFHAVDARARALKISRSKLLAVAASEYLQKLEPSVDATQAWNRALAHAGQPGEQPAAVAFRNRTKRVVRESWQKRR